MSAVDDDGGPAFPTEYAETDRQIAHTASGMSLRDYFAAQALAGIASRSPDWHDESVAVGAYRLADAMLAERDRVKP